MLETQSTIILTDIQIQYRFDSIQSGGLAFCITKYPLAFNVSRSQIIGYQFQDSSESGYLISFINISVKINLHQLKVCSNILNNVGLSSGSFLQQSENSQIQCNNLCNGSGYVVYGLCKTDLIFGYTNINNTKSCVAPFEFNSLQCVCSDGFLLNGTKCINIIQQLTNLDSYVFNNVSQLNQDLQNNISALNTQLLSKLSQLDGYLAANVTQLNSTVNSVNNSLFTLISSVNSSMLSITYQLNLTAQSLRSDLTTTNSSILQKIQQINTEQQAMNATINAILAQLTQQKSDYTQINNSLNSFKIQQQTVDQTQNNALNNHQSQITNLNSQLSTNFNTLSGSISQLRTDMNNINNQQNNAMSSSSSYLQNQINALGGKIQSSTITVGTGQNCGSVLTLCSGSLCGFMQYGRPNGESGQRNCSGGR
ncbi:Hypothetical_protein [Hexamita inflata]|uniref:Hypothetical_protein n=1 Tax=Hexamita inflata TaxID=28002 RepID=A0AA86PVS9_9EUKA|nr:Hypothetical protein HINF_LOCUS29905 [Hexamita inflata]